MCLKPLGTFGAPGILHSCQTAFQLVYPLTDNKALTLLKKIIFYWDLVPHIAF